MVEHDALPHYSGKSQITNWYSKLVDRIGSHLLNLIYFDQLIPSPNRHCAVTKIKIG